MFDWPFLIAASAPRNQTKNISNWLIKPKPIYLYLCFLIVLLLNSPLECVPLTISYYLYFLRISKVWSMLYHGSVGPVQSKNSYFMFTYTLFGIFCCFSSKKMCFYNFHDFFRWNIKFPQQNINQSETGIGHKKLSMELYYKMYLGSRTINPWIVVIIVPPDN